VRSHTDHIPNQIGDAGEESLAGVLAQNSALAYLHISCNEPLLLLVLLLLLLLRTTDVFLVACLPKMAKSKQCKVPTKEEV
jgi:hypothetical protein